MTLYAVEDLDDALEATRRLLLPIDRSTWLRLAVVVFFVGGASTSSNPQVNFSLGSGDVRMPPGPFEPGPRFFLLAAAVVALVLLVGLGFLLVGSIMEFVFVESLRTRTVRVRRYWSEHWHEGVYLWGFRLGIGLVGLGAFAVLAGFAIVPAFSGLGGLSVLALLFVVPAAIVLGIVLALLNAFTTAFVVPVMLVEEVGVVDGWRRFWPTLTANWTQYLAYVGVGLLLSLLAGLLVGFVTAVLAVLLLIPFGIVGAIGFGLYTLVEPLGVLILALTGVLFGLAVLVVVALVQVPVQTYLRYYALLILGDVTSEFDLIPDLRAAVREGGEVAAQEE